MKKEKVLFWLRVYRILNRIRQNCDKFSNFTLEGFDLSLSGVYIFLQTFVFELCGLVLVIIVCLGFFQDKNPLLSF